MVSSCHYLQTSDKAETNTLAYLALMLVKKFIKYLADRGNEKVGSQMFQNCIEIWEKCSEVFSTLNYCIYIFRKTMPIFGGAR